jgi:hypothetical protein
MVRALVHFGGANPLVCGKINRLVAFGPAAAQGVSGTGAEKSRVEPGETAGFIETIVYPPKAGVSYLEP